jgi:DNA-directed RNA polymerase specialized sigma24 family protein
MSDLIQTISAVAPIKPGGWRGLRLKMAVKVPAAVLYGRFAGFVAQMKREDSEAVEDAIAEGMLYLAELDREWPADMGPDEFRMTAWGYLVNFYRKMYHRFHGVYWSRGEVGRKTKRVRVDLDDAAPFLEAKAEDPDPALDAQEILAVLGEEEKQVAWAVLAEGKSERRAAEELGLSRRVVARRLATARRKLGWFDASEADV